MYVDSRDDDGVELAVEIFRILADATRVRLLRALTDPAQEDATRELSVSQLADAVNKRPGAVSQHLAKLRMARLVTTRRDGTKVLYRAANEHVGQLVEDALRQSEHLGSGVPPHHRPSEDVRHTRQTSTRPNGSD
jgi:DNA-binding transcriptional ArsR family regulator